MTLVVVPCLIIGIIIAVFEVWWFISERKNYNPAELDRKRILKALQHFFQPDWKKLAIFAVFMFIAFVGSTQTWAFGGRDLPKPLFYDLLPGGPIWWTIWVILLLPIIKLFDLIVAVAGHNVDFIRQIPLWLVWIIQAVYFYTISCLIIIVGAQFFRKLQKLLRIG